MSKTYETGHAKNVANFETMISFVTAYGAAYNPSKTFIQLANLQAKASAANAVVNQLHLESANFGNAAASRELAFAPMQKLSTRILNALKASDVAKPIVDNLQTLNRKMHGKRASAKITEEEKAALLAEGKEVNQISTSQLSYDNVLDTFDKLVTLLTTIPQYSPNEPELQLATLQALYATLKAENMAVKNVSTNLSNKRLERNEILYNEETGLVTLASFTKNYVKSLYGATAPQYKQISALAFKSFAG